MKIPVVHGLIDRRILINFTADPDVLERYLPAPFRPKLYNDRAIVGICLIRLKNIRPKGLPDFVGVSSENSAHRIAVEWEEDGQTKEGVYIPRRDTSLTLSALIGGRIFPGKHSLAKFDVKEENGYYHVGFSSLDNTRISIEAYETNELHKGSIFKTQENASEFFERGVIGYSPNKNKFDGLRLQTNTWKVTPLEVTHVESSFFGDEQRFPKGAVVFDNALLMKGIEHEWHSWPSMKCKS